MVNEITFDKLPQAVGYLTEQVERIHKAQRLSPRRPKSHWTQLNMDRCMSLEQRGLMTDAGRRALEKAFDYEIVSPYSEMNQKIS